MRVVSLWLWWLTAMGLYELTVVGIWVGGFEGRFGRRTPAWIQHI